MNGYSTGDFELDALLVAVAAADKIDPLLIYAMMAQESGFRAKALSAKGACGLMQLLPATAARFGVRDLFNPQQNIMAGVKYLRFLLNLFDGNLALALAGYNAGEGAVIKYHRQIPPYAETQNYVRLIIQRYERLQERPLKNANRVAQLSEHRAARQTPRADNQPNKKGATPTLFFWN